MSAAVGNKLRLAREALKLTLEQAAAETHIGLHYLRAMEAGNFDALPSRVQMRGFLRAYAGYLHLDTIPLFEALEKDALMALMPPQASLAEDKPTDVKSSAKITPTQEAETNFIKVGETLKNQRELLGLSLDDVARHTHLRLHYLQALERGDMDDLPSAVQGTGMLKNYAEFLSLDPEPMLLRYAEKLQAQLGERKVSISLSTAAREWLAEKGYDHLYGARPLSRIIQEKVKKPLADELLFGKLAKGGRVIVGLEDGALTFTYEVQALPARKPSDFKVPVPVKG